MPEPEPRPLACDIEIVERTTRLDSVHGIVVPNEIRINGRPVLAPSDRPVIVHGIELDDRSAVQVTLTLFARIVRIGAEPAQPADHDIDRWADDGGKHV